MKPLMVWAVSAYTLAVVIGLLCLLPSAWWPWSVL